MSKIRKELNYKYLFENAISGVCLTNYEGNIIDCNDTFINITQNENIDKVLSLNINDCFVDVEKEPFNLINSTLSGETKQFYLFLKEDDNKTLLVTAKELMLENFRHILVNVIEINNEDNFKKEAPHKVDKKDFHIENLKKKLFLAETKFTKILELSDSAICIQDEEKILFVNPAWEKLTGYSKNEINSITPIQFIHESYKVLVQKRINARFIGKKVPDKFDLKLSTKDNSPVWANVTVSMVEHDQKRALMSVYTDISERMRNQQALKESKKKFQSLFYENNSIMFVVDPKTGNIVDANEAACKFYGYSTTKIKSLSINDLSALSKKEIDEQIDSAMKGKKEHFVFKHKLSNNEIRDVEVYSGKVEIKEAILLYSVVHDITARKRAEEALKQSEAKLKKLNAQKDRFFSIIAHDLRGPLGSFMQLTEYMKENYDELSNSEFKEYFNHLYTSAKGTFKLLENLLVWTRSQLGAINLEPKKFDIQIPINDIISIYTEGARAKEITLNSNIKEGTFIYADENTFATIIRNLVSNAIKFTPKNGSITIDAKATDDYMTEISVSDTGLGIPEEQIGKLFKIEQNFSTYGTNNEKGTGLGLILCKELVKKNNGEINVLSKKGKGTTFHIQLPSVNK